MGSAALKRAYAEQLLVFGSIPDELQPEFGIAYHYDDEPDIRHAIRCVITPYFSRWDDESKTEARKVFAEILMSGQTVWLEDAWEADLPPVDLPNEPLRFVQILWDELWPGQDPADGYDPDAAVDPEPDACNRMRVAPADGPEIAPNLMELPSQLSGSS